MNHLFAKRLLRASLLRWCLLLCVGIAVIVSSACTGPAGPAGPAGRDGVGAQIATITVTPSQWQPTDNYFASGWQNVPAITANVISTGVVLAYMRFDNNVWQVMPVTFYFSNTIQVFDFQYRTGAVNLFLNQPGALPARPTGNLVFRIVVLTGSNAVSALKTVDVANYHAVEQAFNLVQ